jgi:predicted PurR-regulated permease PerM
MPRLLARTGREPGGDEQPAASVRRPDPQAGAGAAALLAQGLLQLVLVIFFVFFIFRDAHIYADALHTGSRALAGDLGERMLALAEGTVTGVMVGIVGTAAAQAVVAMIGFLIAGVPGIVILTVATFFFRWCRWSARR